MPRGASAAVDDARGLGKGAKGVFQELSGCSARASKDAQQWPCKLAVCSLGRLLRGSFRCWLAQGWPLDAGSRCAGDVSRFEALIVVELVMFERLATQAVEAIER